MSAESILGGLMLAILLAGVYLLAWMELHEVTPRDQDPGGPAGDSRSGSPRIPLAKREDRPE